jgi:hypothetical protein
MIQSIDILSWSESPARVISTLIVGLEWRYQIYSRKNLLKFPNLDNQARSQMKGSNFCFLFHKVEDTYFFKYWTRPYFLQVLLDKTNNLEVIIVFPFFTVFISETLTCFLSYKILDFE